VLQFISTVTYFETLYGFRLHHTLCHPPPSLSSAPLLCYPAPFSVIRPPSVLSGPFFVIRPLLCYPAPSVLSGPFFVILSEAKNLRFGNRL